MKNTDIHTPGYKPYAIVLVILLAFTALSVLVTDIHLGAITVGIALLIASIKVAVVIYYFMHLRSESAFLKVAVSGVFLIFALVIIITFFDYLLR